MKRLVLASAFVVVAICLMAPSVMTGQEATPRLTTVAPDPAKVGDTLTTEGENLGKNVVAELYLTDGKNDMKMEMTVQEEKSIKFKVPAGTKTGRFNLMILTKGAEPKLMQQPVRVTIE